MRKVKNIIMILIIIVLGIGMYFTIQSAKKSIKNDIPNMDIKVDQPDINNTNNTPPIMDNHGSNMEVNNKSISAIYYVLLGVESMCISLVLIYLLISKFNSKEVFNNKDKLIIYILSIILLSTILTTTGVLISSSTNNENVEFKDLQKEEETKASEIENGTIVNDTNIDLSKYSSNITINKSGEYTLTGSFKYSILVDADSDVVLNLDNVNIESSIKSAIANRSENKLTINILKDTTNTLKDNGYSEYDGCIFSYGELVIDGTGTLNIYGNQEEGEGIATKGKPITINNGNIYIESNDDGLNVGGDGDTITINDGFVYIKASGDGIDSNKDLIINGGMVYTIGSSIGGDAGIDTDKGYTINGGNVVALGSDMLEYPTDSSKQYSVCFNLNNKISNGTLVTLVNDKDEVIISFEANEDFKTLIISSDKLENGTYYLLTGGENTGDSTKGIFTKSNYTNGDKYKEITISSKVTKVS